VVRQLWIIGISFDELRRLRHSLKPDNLDAALRDHFLGVLAQIIRGTVFTREDISLSPEQILEDIRVETAIAIASLFLVAKADHRALEFVLFRKDWTD
jgi:hypothetical protein